MSDKHSRTVGTQDTEARGAARDQAGSAGSPGEVTEKASNRSASLWADAWRELRHDKVFLVAAVVVFVFVLMAAFPVLFTSTNPRDCSLSRSLTTPSAEHWFG